MKSRHLLLLMLAGCAPKPQAWTDNHEGSEEDAFLVDSDFACFRDEAMVGRSYYWNVNGHTEETLRVAREGGVFPVGTVIQLAPIEAMVKRRQGFAPETDDWEFFKLATVDGTRVITDRGTDKVRNIAGSCIRCHSGAAAEWDKVCGADHGCKPLPGFVLKSGARKVAHDPLCD